MEINPFSPRESPPPPRHSHVYASSTRFYLIPISCLPCSPLSQLAIPYFEFLSFPPIPPPFTDQVHQCTSTVSLLQPHLSNIPVVRL